MDIQLSGGRECRRTSGGKSGLTPLGHPSMTQDAVWTKRHLGVHLTPHKLRHAYGRQCVDLGVDIRIIAEALGHESLESTKIYTQVSFQRTRRIAELFGSPGEVR